MRMSLKRKFLWPTLALIVVGMGLSSVISYNLSGNALKSAITAQIENITGTTVQNLDAWLNDRTVDVGGWSRQKVFQTALQDSFVGKAARKSASVSLGRLKDDYQYYENICLADLNGELVAAADTGVVGKVEVSDREYYRSAVKGELVISDVVRSKGTGNPVFIIAAPVSENDAVAGVIFGVVDLSYVTDHFITPIRIGASGYAYLYQNDGLVIAHPDKTQVMSTNIKDFDFGREMMTGKEGWMTYTFKGMEEIANYMPLQRMAWTLSVGASTKEIYAPVKRLGIVNGAVAVSVVLLAVVVILLLTRSIVNPINQIATGLREASNQVAAGSGQVSTSSQQLAEGSSEQAASIEETSSSLEEMSSMTKQNADNAQQADGLMKEANQVVTRADESMKELTRSMEAISTASEETSKIIKTIDEIAFQTNLLALNAAVEAARAGEAGAGFAVVADEVRNLAIRAADAADNTANLIEGTVKKVKSGGNLVASTNKAFVAVAESSNKVSSLVSEIAAASFEQAEGIEQVNKAVVQMDKVTQQNAANAEESASAAEEMNAQAAQMQNFVAQLVELVDGSRSPARKQEDRPRGVGLPVKNTPTSSVQKRPVSNRAKTVAPGDIIPLADGDDFKDF